MSEQMPGTSPEDRQTDMRDKIRDAADAAGHFSREGLAEDERAAMQRANRLVRRLHGLPEDSDAPLSPSQHLQNRTADLAREAHIAEHSDQLLEEAAALERKAIEQQIPPEYRDQAGTEVDGGDTP